MSANFIFNILELAAQARVGEYITANKGCKHELDEYMSHKNLTLEHWSQYNLMQQMANIGSEIFRTLAWREKDKELSQKAFERSLELFDLTTKTDLNFPRLKEVRRAREAWCDYIAGDNSYSSTAKQWESYFYQFNYAANLHK